MGFWLGPQKWTEGLGKSQIKKLKLDFCCICSTWDVVLFAGTELSLWDLRFWWCGLLGQWHSHIPKTWLFSYSNTSTDQLPVVSLIAYDFRREVHVEQNILKAETKQWTNWYTFTPFWFFFNTVPTLCVFTHLTACCLTRWLCFHSCS
jgi:hypothetical protein